MFIKLPASASLINQERVMPVIMKMILMASMGLLRKNTFVSTALSFELLSLCVLNVHGSFNEHCRPTDVMILSVQLAKYQVRSFKKFNNVFITVSSYLVIYYITVDVLNLISDVTTHQASVGQRCLTLRTCKKAMSTATITTTSA